MLHKVKERIHRETSHAISIKRCKCMSGFMDGYDLLLMAFLSRIIPMSLSSFFLRHGYPFFSFFFFGSCFFGMPSFLFLGQPLSDFILFQGCSTREITKTWIIYYVEWIGGGSNSQCRNVVIGWDVYVLMIEKAWNASH